MSTPNAPASAIPSLFTTIWNSGRSFNPSAQIIHAVYLAMAEMAFKAALIVVDVQEDFCPPNGALAVTDGRDIIPSVNALLKMPFALKIATKDWHPANHISFAANHRDKEPYTSLITVVNPKNPSESYDTRLWPVHCVQGTAGAELVPELDTHQVDEIIEKGQNSRVEMYSAFYDPLKAPRISDSGLTAMLKKHDISDCYVVGLAADYCVKSTAEDAAREGFRTWIVEEATKPVGPDDWIKYKLGLGKSGVTIISIHGPEIARLSQ